jgi:appr-1-p processing enzyme family domain protein
LSCLEIASENKVKSIAFCCISTGEFHFPNTIAAEIAIDMVKRYLKEKDRKLKVVFNVFKSEDEEIYQELLS